VLTGHNSRYVRVYNIYVNRPSVWFAHVNPCADLAARWIQTSNLNEWEEAGRATGPANCYFIHTVLEYRDDVEARASTRA
jgi:hypothetical protein